MARTRRRSPESPQALTIGSSPVPCVRGADVGDGVRDRCWAVIPQKPPWARRGTAGGQADATSRHRDCDAGMTPSRRSARPSGSSMSLCSSSSCGPARVHGRDVMAVPSIGLNGPVQLRGVLRSLARFPGYGLRIVPAVLTLRALPPRWPAAYLADAEHHGQGYTQDTSGAVQRSFTVTANGAASAPTPVRRPPHTRVEAAKSLHPHPDANLVRTDVRDLDPPTPTALASGVHTRAHVDKLHSAQFSR